MDIHQLRSWIFELYEPLENERQYIVYDFARGNLLIDIPPFSARASRLIEGTGRPSLLVATNAARAKEAEKFRETLGVAQCEHKATRSFGGEPDVSRRRRAPRRNARATEYATARGHAVLPCAKPAACCMRRSNLASDAAHERIKLESLVLSAGRAPMWNAARTRCSAAARVRSQEWFPSSSHRPWERATGPSREPDGANERSSA